MRKFRFLLQTLLKIRQDQSTQAQNRLREANLAMQAAANALENYKLELAKAENAIRARQQKESSVDSLEKLYGYSHLISEKIERQIQVIKEAKQRVDLRRHESMLAMQKLRVIETLKDKKYREWEYTYNQEEGKAADDFATQRFVHKRNKM